MLFALKIVTISLVAISMALALAHALEWPGKMRLSKEDYLAVQPIYYPGFTIGGVAEPLSILLALVLTALTPSGSAAFVLMIGACLALIAMHLTYWLMTHPVNNFWLTDVKLKKAGSLFFSLGRGSDAADWTALRDQWERSHILRAAFGFLGFVLIVTAQLLDAQSR
jgi:hypothetical protein